MKIVFFFSVDLGASVTVSSSIEVDAVVHTLRDKKIKDNEISFATSTQDFELSHENNGKFYKVVAKVGIHADASLKPFNTPIPHRPRIPRIDTN